MALTEPAVGSSNWGPVLNTALTQLDTIGPSSALATQTLASAGAVTINAASGQVQLVTLQANASSSSITNPSSGQLLIIALRQDATGGRTFAWPANFKFAAGTAPTLSAANKTDVVRAFYDGTNWIETSRSLNVG